jgi:hypothetical protein
MWRAIFLKSGCDKWKTERIKHFALASLKTNLWENTNDWLAFIVYILQELDAVNLVSSEPDSENAHHFSELKTLVKYNLRVDGFCGLIYELILEMKI